MNSKLTTIVLSVLLVASLAYAVYTSSQLSAKNEEIKTCQEKYDTDVNEWKGKYEEALIDMEEAFKRLEEKDNELKAALEEKKKKK